MYIAKGFGLLGFGKGTLKKMALEHLLFLDVLNEELNRSTD